MTLDTRLPDEVCTNLTSREFKLVVRPNLTRSLRRQHFCTAVHVVGIVG